MKYCLLILVCLCGLPNNISSYRQQNYGRILKWPYIHQINTHQRQQQQQLRYVNDSYMYLELIRVYSLLVMNI